MTTQINEFFATARERYHIKLRRESGLQKPWSGDPIFQQWRFCNVFREHDRTTEWFRREIREKVRGLKAIEAVVIFRWFNRVETGEIIKDLILGDWDTQEARRRLEHVRPLVTGAYIIKGRDGMEKLDGVLACIDQFLEMVRQDSDEPGLGMAARYWMDVPCLENAWNDLRSVPYLGPFMAYEAVSDLRWTNVLEKATDILTWANPGPGCTRGLRRVMFGEDNGRWNRHSVLDQREMLSIMRDLLTDSRRDSLWPSEWPKWEMREVEHWLCEFDKYERARLGDPLKRKYPGVV